MVRYKGQIRRERTEREFPHIVEMAVPAGGLGRKSDDIAVWHRERSLDMRHGRGDYRAAVWYVTWCFLNPSDAEIFKTEFGGRLKDPAHLAKRPQKRGRR